VQGKNLTSKQTIGDRVRQRRRLFELTQRALAEKVGLSGGAIGRMESERGYVTSRPTIMALAQALFCDADWLETGEGEVCGSSKSSEAVLQRDRELKAFMESLPRNVRATFSQASLVSGHFKDMETLLEMALASRIPFPNGAREKEFQWFLRQWGKKRDRGREAIIAASDLLTILAHIQLRELVATATTSKVKSGPGAD
jgi:transcriptional regulator with XRE-family HTH domain